MNKKQLLFPYRYGFVTYAGKPITFGATHYTEIEARAVYDKFRRYMEEAHDKQEKSPSGTPE